jgi:hypothetical protein
MAMIADVAREAQVGLLRRSRARRPGLQRPAPGRYEQALAAAGLEPGGDAVTGLQLPVGLVVRSTTAEAGTQRLAMTGSQARSLRHERTDRGQSTFTDHID